MSDFQTREIAICSARRHPGWFGRSFLLSRVTLLFCLGFVVVMWGMAVQVPAQATGEFPAEVTETVAAKDGQQISMTYYASVEGKESPVVVLLHEKESSRFVWQGEKGFAKELQARGYAVVTVDLRGHGESKTGGAGLPGGNANQDEDKKKGTPAKKPKEAPKKTAKAATSAELAKGDYQAMIFLDLEAVKKFIFDEHQKQKLNMNKMAIVGVEMSANVAAQYAAYDWLKEPHSDGVGIARTPRGQDVRALVLISPVSSLPGYPISKALTELRSEPLNVAFYVAVSKADAKDKGQAKKIFEQLTQLPNSRKRMYFDEFPGSYHGTQLLGKPNVNLEGLMTAFFEKHLKGAQSTWIDRRSKLNRTDN